MGLLCRNIICMYGVTWVGSLICLGLEFGLEFGVDGEHIFFLCVCSLVVVGIGNC